jgi:hypothetical protein
LKSLLRYGVAFIALVSAVLPARAQDRAAKLDLAVTFAADRSLKANTSENVWLDGGSVELGANIWKGLGIGANVTGLHASSIGSSGIPLSLVTVTFGPRYRWHAQHKLSLYGEGLLGEANGFDSLFPSKNVAPSSTNALAFQIGGGMDYKLSRRFAIRVLDVSWVRTQLPNSSDDIQNNLRLGAGFVLRFAH